MFGRSMTRDMTRGNPIKLILAVFGKMLIGIFVEPSETEVVKNAYPYLVVCGIMMWSLGLLFVFRFSLQALGDTVTPMFSGILELLVRPTVVFCLPEAMGFYRMSIAESSTWLLTATMLCIGYFIRIRKIELDPELVIRRKKT